MGITVGTLWERGNRTGLSQHRRWTQVVAKLDLKVSLTLEPVS